MTNMTCATVQDLLPELATGRLGGGESESVESHLAGCSRCREALDVLTLLTASPPTEAPPELEARIQAAVRQELAMTGTRRAPAAHGARRGWHIPAPAWGLAAAAVLALVMGRTLLPGGEQEPELLALGQEDLPVLLADDGMVAGAPVFDGLSDDDLALLLEELER